MNHSELHRFVPLSFICLYYIMLLEVCQALFLIFIFRGGVVVHPFLLETYQTQFEISVENFVHLFGNILTVVDSPHLTKSCDEHCGDHASSYILAEDNACTCKGSSASSVCGISPENRNHFFTDADGVDDSFDSFGSLIEKMVAVSVLGRHFVVPLSFLYLNYNTCLPVCQ